MLDDCLSTSSYFHNLVNHRDDKNDMKTSSFHLCSETLLRHGSKSYCRWLVIYFASGPFLFFLFFSISITSINKKCTTSACLILSLNNANYFTHFRICFNWFSQSIHFFRWKKQNIMTVWNNSSSNPIDITFQPLSC